MKLFSKLFLVLNLFSSNHISAIAWYPWLYTAIKLNFDISMFQSTGQSLLLAYQYKKNLPLLPDASEAIVTFCHEKLKSHNLEPQNFKIKIKDDTGFLAAYGSDYILINSITAQELENALSKPNDETSKKILKIYSTFLDHEISHLIHHDGPTKRIAVLAAMNSILYAAAFYAMKSPRISFLYQEPTKIKDLFITAYAYGLTNLGANLLTKLVYGLYTQQQESRADDYAISRAQDPEALRMSAKYLELLDDGIVKVLCGSEMSAHLPVMVQFTIGYFRSVLIAEYNQLKPAEDMHSWMKKQKSVLAYLKFIIDVEHPSGFSRAEKMRKAADALEATQQPSISNRAQAAAAA